MLETHKNDIRKTWNIMNSIIGRTRNKTSIPSTFIVNGREETNELAIANSFCDYFTNIGKQYADKIPDAQHSVEYYMKSERNRYSMFLSPVDPVEIEKILKLYKAKKSSGHDGLNMILVKALGKELSIPLSKVINKSLATGQVPEDMKLAKIVPLYKAKSKELFTNYRPISLLPVFSKVLEKVVYKRLYSFLNKHDILYPHQYGFRHKHSTCDALCDFTYNMLQAFENKHASLAVYLDLFKAFDTIDHGILLRKMEHYGIRGIALDWIRSYLNQRKQYLSFKGTNSHVFTMPCGVPQGSVLGPLLFILYSNDIPKSLEHCKAILFADDTTLYLSSPDIRNLYCHMNNDLDNLNDWFKANKLSLNASKTKYMSFNMKNGHHLLNLSIGDDFLEKVNETKFLGIIIDDELKWNKHIDYCRKKISSGVYAMNSAKHILSTNHLRILYSSLIQPYLTYGNLLWGNALKKYITPIEIQQKKSIRCMYKTSYNAHTSPLFKEARILKLRDMHILQLSKLAYNFMHRNLPLPLTRMFKRNIDIHNVNTRQVHNLSLPKVIHNIQKRSFVYECPNTWNKLDNTIKLSPTMPTFKRKMKHIFIDQY